jgi:flagellar basal body-associated protein FliL
MALHLLTTIGIVLSAYGGAHLGQPESAKNNHAKDNTIRKVGSLLLVLTAMLLIAYAFYTYRRLKALSNSRLNHNAIHLLYFAMLALPFAVIRATYGVVYSFDHSSTVNPVTGVFAVKLVLIFLVQLLAVIALAIGGIMTRNIRMEDESISSGTEYTRAATGEPTSDPSNKGLVLDEYGVVQGQHA